MNQLKTVVLLGALSALVLGIGALVAPHMLWVFGAIVVVMNLVSYFLSDKIVLAMHRARPIGEGEDPALHRMVAELAQKAGIPKPRVYLLPDETPNAFATGRNPKNGVVAVTTGIRRLLSERELRGVIAHELGHIRNRDILVATVAGMLAGVISMIANVLQWGAILGTGSRDDEDRGSPIAMIVLAIVAPIAATLIQLAISRQREYGADRAGAELSGDPGALADALLKLERGVERIPVQVTNAHPATASLFIVNPLRGGGVMSLFSTHPAVSDRVARLRAIEQELGGRWAVAARR
jgi:heat shock protein HtpX